MKPFGIKVTIIEPGAYATEFGSQQTLKFAADLDIYADLRTRIVERLKNIERGDPDATQRPYSK
jgi:NAD(P)-dependent dehydrogenase (short-subunit alcohol dehydrogenase family)